MTREPGGSVPKWGFLHAISKNGWKHDWGNRLPAEILERIIDYLAPGARDLINIDRRSSLSIESFGSSAQLGVDYSSLGNWRCVSKRFAEIGARTMFTRVSVRLGSAGFKRLHDFVEDNPAICAVVKKFSYMTYGFSSLENDTFEALLTDTRADIVRLEHELDRWKSAAGDPMEERTSEDLRTKFAHAKSNEEAIGKMMLRSEDQRAVVETGIDATGLFNAFTAFTSLQQIRLMPCHSDLDDKWGRFCKNKPSLYTTESRTSRWKCAYEHASMTLGAAYLKSGSPATRVSMRRVPPLLLPNITQSLFNAEQVLNINVGGQFDLHSEMLEHSALFLKVAERLQTLELNFDDRSDLHKEMMEHSGLFQKAFSASVNIRALYIGFSRPVSIDFDSVFGVVEWKQLQNVGFSAWKLNSENIIKFLLRHKNSLKAVRLRGVLLEDDSRWVDVLKVLRRDMALSWVSLRWVGYSNQDFGLPAHSHHSDDEHDTSNDSSDESEFEISESDEASIDPDSPITNQGTAIAQAENEEDSESENSESVDSETGEGVNTLAVADQYMLLHIDPQPMSPTLSCHCHGGYAWEDLPDDHRVAPSKALWKIWEAWVVRRCPLGHDSGKE